MIRNLFASFLVALVALSASSAPVSAGRATRLTIINDTHWPAWITVYSAGGVRIEKAFAVDPHRRKSVEDWTFTDLTWHVVRAEFKEINWVGPVLCDTRKTAYFRTRTGYDQLDLAVVSVYYDGGRNCSLHVGD